MIEKLNWLFIIWTLSKKFTQDYTDKEWNKKEAYRLKFDYMGWTYQVNCDDVVYTKLEPWMIYIVEVWVFTTEKLSFSSLSTNKNKKIYEVWDWVLTDII